MKILLLSIISVLSIGIIINSDTAYAQFGGPVMGPSVSISDIVSSGSNIYVSWNGMDSNTKSPSTFLKASNDNGVNFGKTVNLNQFGISPRDLSMSNMKMTSSESNLYLAWSDWKNDAPSSNVFLMKSTDGGNTFRKPLEVKTGSGISTVAAITASEKNVYVLMYNNTGTDYSDLLFVSSNDNGITFGKPLSLSTNHKLIMGNVQMTTFENNVYIIASGSYWGSQNGAVMLYASHNNGKSFLPVTITDDVQAFIPQVAVSGNNVYVIWTQMARQGSILYFEKSTDGGTSLGNKSQINQDGEPRWPQMIVSKNNVFVKWVQSFPSGGTKMLLSKITDNGNSFSVPLNLGGYTAGFDFSQIGTLENGDLVAIWVGQYDPSYSHSGIFFRKSTDGGETFGEIYDLNVSSKTPIVNPKVAFAQNHIYVAGDSAAAQISDIAFRASLDSGNTFTGPTNLNSDGPLQSSNSSLLVPIPQFKPDIPTSVPPNSRFSNSQNASFVLGQLDFVSNTANPTASTFSIPHFIAFDSHGNLWVSDGGNDRVLEFSSPFTIGKSASVVLGQKDFTSWQVLNGTNPKSLDQPQGLAFDKDGNLWIADGASNRILEFEPPFKTGQIPSLVLGQKDFGTGDYPSSETAQTMYYPEGIAFDPDGNLWIADTNGRLLEFKPPFTNGENPSLAVRNQNGGSVSSSTVSTPSGITFDKNGSLWVADSGNYRILRFDKPFSNNQTASLVLGHEDFTTGGEGISSNASSFRDPYGLTFDFQGNLWMSDSGNNRVLEFVPPFTNGQRASLIFGQTSYNAGAIDTAGHTASSLNQPQGIAFDSDGNLWVSDSANNRILVYKSNTSKSSQILFPDFGPDYQSKQNENYANAYEQAANQMTECSKKLGISSDNQTAINLVLGSTEFKSKVEGYDYKSNGIANSFHLCTLDTVEAVYSLYDKDGKYVKSLYVSIDPSLTMILGIREEVWGARYGGASPANMQQNKPQQNETSSDTIFSTTERSVILTQFDISFLKNDFTKTGVSQQILVLKPNQTTDIHVMVSNNDNKTHQVYLKVPMENLENFVSSYSFGSSTLTVYPHSSNETILRIKAAGINDTQTGVVSILAQDRSFGIKSKAFYLAVGNDIPDSRLDWIGQSLREAMPGPAFPNLHALDSKQNQIAGNAFGIPTYLPSGYKLQGISDQSPGSLLVYSPVMVTSNTTALYFQRSGGITIYYQTNEPGFDPYKWMPAYIGQQDGEQEVSVNGIIGVAADQQKRQADNIQFMSPAEIILFKGTSQIGIRGNISLEELLKMASSVPIITNQALLADCGEDKDFPGKPCNDVIDTANPNQKPILGDKNNWQVFYNMKGKEWMESKKQEMYFADKNGILKEWYEYGGSSGHFANADVWYYYSLYGESPDIARYYDGMVQKNWIYPIITYYYVSQIVFVIIGVVAVVAGFFVSRKILVKTRK